MNFLRDRCEQLANFLRDGILQGEYPVPLPPTRVWCQQLGVGRPTLLRALQILNAEGLISMTKRGAILKSVNRRPKPELHAATKVVRILTYGDTGGNFEMEIIRLSEQLQIQGIRLVVESCNLPRLKSIAAQPQNPWELCCLLSIPIGYQKYFFHRKDSVLVIGFTNSGFPLHYLTPDLMGSTRHATHGLLRQGFKHLVMLNRVANTAGVAQCVETFKTTCANWRTQPIQADIQLIHCDYGSMRNAIKKLVNKIKGPFGIVTHAPISVGILVSALLQKGFKIPEQVSIRTIEYRLEEVQFCVPIIQYQVSIDRYTKEILHAALHYFETGKLPETKKILPMSVTTHGPEQ